MYEVDEKMFSVLDKLEDYPSWYTREIFDMKAEDESIIPCWIYFLKNFPESLLKLNYLDSYEDSSDRKYLERSQRHLSILARDDLEYGIN